MNLKNRGSVMSINLLTYIIPEKRAMNKIIILISSVITIQTCNANNEYANVFGVEIYDQKPVFSKLKLEKGSFQKADGFVLKDEEVVKDLTILLFEQKRKALEKYSISELKEKVTKLRGENESAVQGEFYKELIEQGSQVLGNIGLLVGISASTSTGITPSQIGSALGNLCAVPAKIFAREKFNKGFPRQKVDEIEKEIRKLEEDIRKKLKGLDNEPILPYELRFIKTKFFMHKNHIMHGIDENIAYLEKIEKELLNARRAAYNLPSIETFIDRALTLPIFAKSLLLQDQPHNSSSKLQQRFENDNVFKIFSKAEKDKIWNLISKVAFASLDVKPNPSVSSRLRVCLVGPPSVGKSIIASNIPQFLTLPFESFTFISDRDLETHSIFGTDNTHGSGKIGWIFNPLLKKSMENDDKGTTYKNAFLVINDIHTILKNPNSPAFRLFLKLLEDHMDPITSDYFKFPYDINMLNIIMTSNEDIPETDEFKPLRQRIEVVHISDLTPIEKLQIITPFVEEAKKRYCLNNFNIEFASINNQFTTKYTHGNIERVLATSIMPDIFIDKSVRDQKQITSRITAQFHTEMMSLRSEWYNNALGAVNEDEKISWLTPAAFLEHPESTLALANLYANKNDKDPAKKWHLKTLQLTQAPQSITWLQNHWKNVPEVDKPAAFEELENHQSVLPKTQESYETFKSFGDYFRVKKQFDKTLRANFLAATHNPLDVERLDINNVTLTTADIAYINNNIQMLSNLHELNICGTDLSSLGFTFAQLISEKLSTLHKINLLNTGIASAQERKANIRVIETLGNHNLLEEISLDSINLNGLLLSDDEAKSLLSVLGKVRSLEKIELDRSLKDQIKLTNLLNVLRARSSQSVKCLNLSSILVSDESTLLALREFIDSCAFIQTLYLGKFITYGFTTDFANTLISKNTTLKALSFQNSWFPSVNQLESLYYDGLYTLSSIADRLCETIGRLTNLRWLYVAGANMEPKKTVKFSESLAHHPTLEILYCDMAYCESNLYQGFINGKDKGMLLGGGTGMTIGALGGGPGGAFAVGSVLGGAGFFLGGVTGSIVGAIQDYSNMVPTQASLIALNLAKMPKIKELHLFKISKDFIFNGINKLINEERKKDNNKPAVNITWHK
jgi:ATP-dependent Lon protease